VDAQINKFCFVSRRCDLFPQTTAISPGGCQSAEDFGGRDGGKRGLGLMKIL
jgi:hypothetical protein